MLLDVKTSLVSKENMKCKLYLSKSSKEASQKNTHDVSIIAPKYLSKYGFYENKPLNIRKITLFKCSNPSLTISHDVPLRNHCTKNEIFH